jgi:hypothetical protein
MKVVLRFHFHQIKVPVQLLDLLDLLHLHLRHQNLNQYRQDFLEEEILEVYFLYLQHLFHFHPHQNHLENLLLVQYYFLLFHRLEKILYEMMKFVLYQLVLVLQEID